MDTDNISYPGDSKSGKSEVRRTGTRPTANGKERQKRSEKARDQRPEIRGQRSEIRDHRPKKT